MKRPCLLFALLAVAALAPPALAVTPENITLTPASSPASFSTLIGGVGFDRSTCVEDVSCDTLVLDVAAGDYTGKNLRVTLDWAIPANDFDLYCFLNRLNGPEVGSSHDGPPGTHEEFVLSLNGVIAAPRRYVIHMVASATSPETIHGLMTFVAPPAPRVATTAGNDLVFSPNVTVLAPGAARDCEPSLRVDTRGTCYVGGIRGVPAGVDLWRFDLDPSSPTFDPQMRTATYLGQPDAFASPDSAGGKDGGGDIDIATSFPTNGSATPFVTIVSLVAANISAAVSSDRGDNFALSPAVATVPVDDRQWIEADGDATVYQFYRAPIPSTGLFVQRSTDHGVNWGPAALVSPTGSTPGYIDVDHSDGTVYVSHTSSAALFVSRSSDGGQTWSTHTVDNSTSHGNLFDPIKVGDDGTVYATWSSLNAIWLAHSTDRGDTWSAPVKVSRVDTPVALFPWLEAGSAGRVVLAWFGTSSAQNNDGTDWQVYAATTKNATATNPAFNRGLASDHVIHASNISLGGLGVDTPVTPQKNRNLCDYFQVAIDPLGACVVAFADDHNDFDGHTYVSRQLAGPALYASANGGTGELAPITPLPLPTPDPSQPELVDYLHDATGSSAQPIPGDNPFDLLSVDYGCTVQGAAPLLSVRFKLSDLAAVPQNAFWRAFFSANAPGGTADRGEQFYLQAATNGATPAFTFGRAVRSTNGAYVLTSLGVATSGEIRSNDDEIVVRLSLGTLNPFITGQSVQPNSVLVGLKAQTGTLNASAGRDIVRGGGSFRVCSEVLAVEPSVAPGIRLGAPHPNPARGGVTVDLTLERPQWVEVGVFDATGRRVRTVQGGVLAAGTTQLKWDGRTESGHVLSSGAYWIRAVAGGRAFRQQMILVK
ncbi:MAG: FlgD immunoglobulin-like domain containing protein [Candidatus Eisenbacteria bacterium]